MRTAQLKLNLRNRLPWVEMLWTRFRAVHDGVTTVNLEGIIEELESLCLLCVA